MIGRLAGALLLAACAQLALAQAPSSAAPAEKRAAKMREAHQKALENCRSAQPDKQRDERRKAVTQPSS